jgi:hypothetical protein
MKVALYKGKRGGSAGAFDASVRWWTRGPYSHVELIFSDGMSASASSRDGGVRFKRIDFKPEHWDFIDLSVDEEHARASILKQLEHDFDEEAARAFFKEREGLRYDYFGLFGFVWRPGIGKSRRWFCSEAVAAALKFEEPWRFCPNTLAAVIRSIVRQ